MRRIKIIAVLILLVVSYVPAAAEESALVPGEIFQISTYTNFFYNFPTEDFFYYLNDRLLFLEKPDGQIMPNGMRTKLLKIVRWHKLIRKAIQRVKKDKNNMITIDVGNPEGFKKAAIILNLLGQRMSKTPEGKFKLEPNPLAGNTDYFEFSMLKSKTIEIQLNKTHHLHIKLAESYIPVPWDYTFLREITGLNINASNFFETLLKNEQFSLLLGILYRLSDKEINRISGLMKGFHLGAWKEIYKNKKYLMGMFILSHALRVGPDGEWLVPGGPGAEKFWSYLAETDCRKAPLSFLRSLAISRSGKLNYFFVFSTFLPPETQEALFTGPNANKMIDVYRYMSLSRRERLNSTQFPGIKDSSFFTFLYSLRLEDGEFYVPLNENFWMDTISSGISGEYSYGSPGERDEDRTIAADNGEGVSMPDEKGIPEIATGRIIVFGDNGAKEGADLTGTAYAVYSSGEVDKVDDSEAAGKNGSKGSVLAGSRVKKRKLEQSYLADVRRGFFIKASVGGLFSDGGDFQTVIDSSESYYENTTGMPIFLSWAGEFGYSFRRFSIGIEGGGVIKNFKVNFSNNYADSYYKRSLSAYQALVNIYYKFLQTPNIQAYIYGGGGMYSWEYNVDSYSQGSGSLAKYGLYERVKKKTFGYHVGFSADIFFLKRIALVMDARYRFATMDDPYGHGRYLHPHEKYDYEGELTFDPSESAGYADFYVGTDRFSGNPSVLRKADLNLKGFAFTLGAKWCF